MTAPILSQKYIDFLLHQDSTWENLEGTTAAGKTTVGVIKWMLKVADSDHDQHIIAGATKGVIQKNIIQAQLGVLDVFGDQVEERANGSAKNSMPHLIYKTPKGEKTIYLLGYDDKTRWKNALGGQYGCIYIDEINTADMDFVREVGIRYRYMMTTLNPDDPKLDVYSEYINRSRPLDEYKDDVPDEIMAELEQSPAEPGWTYWFFDFYDNAGLSDEQREKIMNSAPKGTKLYKNKIQGLRGRAEGLIFPSFGSKNIITRKQADSKEYQYYTAGVDTSYSQKSEDTISFIFAGITYDGEYIVLDEETYNNRDEVITLAPSDVAKKLVSFLDKNQKRYGLPFYRRVFIDNADQATISELEKLKKEKHLIYNFMNSDKTYKVVDRINSMNGWIRDVDQSDEINYLVVDECEAHIDELEIYQWSGDKPEDRNDHTINASQYAWIPYKHDIGIKKEKKKNNSRAISTRNKLRSLIG